MGTIAFPTVEMVYGDIESLPSWAKNYLNEYTIYKKKEANPLQLFEYGKQLNTPVRMHYREIEFSDELMGYTIEAYIFTWTDAAAELLFKTKYT